MNEHIRAIPLTLGVLVLAVAYLFFIAKLPGIWGLVVAASPIVGMIYYACLLHVREKASKKRIAALEGK